MTTIDPQHAQDGQVELECISLCLVLTSFYQFSFFELCILHACLPFQSIWCSWAAAVCLYSDPSPPPPKRFFTNSCKQEINGRCRHSWLKVHGCQLGYTVARTLSFDFHRCSRFLEDCFQVLVMWKTHKCSKKVHSFYSF